MCNAYLRKECPNFRIRFLFMPYFRDQVTIPFVLSGRPLVLLLYLCYHEYNQHHHHLYWIASDYYNTTNDATKAAPISVLVLMCL